MEKALKLYNSKGAFPSDGNQIEILGFNYDAKRMGGAPIITGTVLHSSCLDGVWTDDVYVSFNGEKYYLKQTPTSSKSNTDARYKHECEFVSERIKLDNVYFIDAVVGNPQESDRVATNSATFSFFGTILEFAKRLNAGLQYSKLQSVNESGEISGYYVEVGNLVDKDGNEFDKEEKFLSFDKVPFSVALQESYNQFGIPYYFEGKKIVFDFYEHAIKTVFKYGADQSLLSITKNNANQKIINRCTGVGSEENIPYYYPNEHPLGIVDTYLNDELNNALVTNDQKFGAKVKNGTELTYSYVDISNVLSSLQIYYKKTFDNFVENYPGNPIRNFDWITVTDFIHDDSFGYDNKSEIGSYSSFNHLTTPVYAGYFALKVILNENAEFQHEIKIVYNTNHYITPIELYIPQKGRDGTIVAKEVDTVKTVDIKEFGYFYVVSHANMTTTKFETFKAEGLDKKRYVWKNESDNIVKLENYGLTFNGMPSVGDILTFKTREGSLLPYQNALMPPIYIETGGEERFYNALDDTYKDENGNYYKFSNPYSDSKRKEHIVEFPYIKPSIENVKNDADKEYINSFIDIKFDDNDNDETYEEEDGGSLKYLHPYFYVKLRKFDGEYGFNLFDHASEQGEMTISMTSGHCGACNFVIGVDENTKKNTLQVDDSGKLVWDSKTGKPKFGEAQGRQNDTRNNEVWIALKKDIETYSHIMPSGDLKPAVGDTFVITNISFPAVYLQQAGKRLEEAIIKFMYENNVEKFTFSIKFSRIYLEEHPEILALLNENSLINIEYNGERKTLYVNSFSYKKEANTALPEITIELAETLSASQNALQTAINEVKIDMLNSFQKMDIAAMIASKFISKENEDQARQRITFNRGLNIGAQDDTKAKIDEAGNADVVSQIIRQYISSPQFIDGFAGAGFKLWLDENGKSNLTVDNITAREAFRVFEMLVTKLRAVNGGLFVSAANGTIKEVVDSGEYYDIILENDNTFVAGDYMRCQVMSGLKIMGYWVEIHSTNGKTCRVLKSEFGDVMPLVGQDVVLDGSKNKGRQNAIHISATEDGQPRIDILNGIATKSHDNCLRARLGNLDGIYDELFGENQPKGDGLYSDNAYLKGEFIVKSTGESVDTMFAVQDGKIKSAVKQTQAETIKGKTLLYNASFTDGLDGWITSNESDTLYDDSGLLFSHDSLLAQSVSIFSDPTFENVFFLNINGGWIKQHSYRFVDKPEFDNTKQYPLFFSCNVRCKVEGELTVKIGDKAIYTGVITPSNNFISFDISKTGDNEELTWNGEGDFYLSFSGEADFYGITIYTEKTEVRHQTLFEQTDKLVRFASERIGEDGNILNGAVVRVETEGDKSGTYIDVVYQEGGEPKRQTLGEFSTNQDGETKIKLSGDNIQLEGDVTANGKVHIDSKTGTLTAKNAEIDNSILNSVEINGAFRNAFQDGWFEINSPNPNISTAATPGLQNNNNVIFPQGEEKEGWDIPENAIRFMEIPASSEYVGFRATLVNDNLEEGNTHAIRNNNADVRFYENGRQFSYLILKPNEGVEMLGYGRGDTFVAWIILNRFFLDSHNGYPLCVMFSGLVDNSGTLTHYRAYNNSKGNGLSASVEGGNNDVVIRFKDSNNNQTEISEDYMVMLTPYGETMANCFIYAKDKNGFVVARRGLDGKLATTGGFSFLVINISDFYNPFYQWTPKQGR